MVTLTLTEEQAKIVSKACEFFARVRIGQFQEITFNLMRDKPLPDDFCRRKEQAEIMLLEARKYIYPELRGMGHSYGIGKFDDADMAYDVHQAISHCLGGPEPYTNRTDFPSCSQQK